jgi:hypothetical protein
LIGLRWRCASSSISFATSGSSVKVVLTLAS